MSRGFENRFGRLAIHAARWAGKAGAFLLAAASVAVWLVVGPFFGWSDDWILLYNTGVTIVTFLMVFLIQHAQNHDTRALHLKLNELVAAHEGASNRLIEVESLSADELERLAARYAQLAQEAKRKGRGATSVEETRS